MVPTVAVAASCDTCFLRRAPGSQSWAAPEARVAPADATTLVDSVVHLAPQQVPASAVDVAYCCGTAPLATSEVAVAQRAGEQEFVFPALVLAESAARREQAPSD